MKPTHRVLPLLLVGLLFLGVLLSTAVAGSPFTAPAPNPPRFPASSTIDPGSDPLSQTLSLQTSQEGDTAVWLPIILGPQREWLLHKTADGSHPDGVEQQLLWLMNRARSNPTQEGIWLAVSSDPTIAGPRDYFDVDVDMLRSEFAGYAAQPPAAFDRRLYEAARAHSEDLIQRDAQDHEGQFDRVENAGFVMANGRGSVFAYAFSGLHAHAAFNIDWGSGPGGMQSGRGHRMAIMSVDGNYTNVGLAAVAEDNAQTSVGPLVITGNYAYAAPVAGHYNVYVVGTVWRDVNQNGLYDAGEGVGGVEVRPDSGAYYATTAVGGGYAIPMPENGRYSITFLTPNHRSTYGVELNSASVLLDVMLQP